MPNTTNYSFPTPADTDLVKNGADAIRDLGDAVDTAMNTALGTKKAGMVLLNTTSFSGVASQVVSNCFSATYVAYQVLINITSASNNDRSIFLKLRNNSTDTSTNYNSFIAAGRRDGTGSNLSQSDDTNGYKLGEIDGPETGNNFAALVTLIGPFVNDRSQMLINTAFVDTGNNFRYGAGGGSRTAGGSHNSLNLIASAGTITGTIRVYGISE